jgi:ATP-dependent DNA helicase RecG
MHRLLQGDVGSGKTVVALAALLGAVQSGHQGALMVPTEVLAEQHAVAVRQMLGDLDVRVELLTSRVKGKARAALLEDLAPGEVAIVVGTHALLTEEVAFKSLGMVVIDEQHRFGVEQRATLRAKGEEGDPDLLVMTATPIPRTAAMVIFGDLDLTTLDEMPPGGWPSPPPGCPIRPTSTWPGTGCARRWRPATGPSWSARWSATRPGSRRGRPPRSGRGWRPGSWPGCGSASCTARCPPPPGRRPWPLPPGEIQVLVATTVIEVGVDVPEATVMVIESADRFGIAQLHQLRGRVGRGAPAQLVLSSSVRVARTGWPGSAWPRWRVPPTGSPWPRRTCACGARGPCWAPASRGRPTCGWPRCPSRRTGPSSTEARRVAEAIVDEDPQLEAHEAWPTRSACS